MKWTISAGSGSSTAARKTGRQDDRQPDVLLVGASVRAAAFSALRAGFSPWTADLFGDADLRAVCPGVVIPRDRRQIGMTHTGNLPATCSRFTTAYPEALAEASQDFDAAIPCVYTGGLENYPEVIARLAAQRPLWGNAPAVLRAVRDPFQVARTLSEAGLQTPALRRTASGLPANGSWLYKPFEGAGGRGIQVWHGQILPRSPAPGFFQEFVPGQPIAALFVADGCRAQFVGATRQIVGEQWLHARPFHYCGSVGPLVPDGAIQQQLQQLGDVLANHFHLCGLFGVDAVLHGSSLWCIEVNPRYPASAEVLEYALGMSAFAAHARAFGANIPPAIPEETIGRNQLAVVGKAILFAPAGLHVAGDVAKLAEGEPHQAWSGLPRGGFVLPAFADLPQPGEWIPAGRPILTLFAEAATEAECLGKLQQTARELDRRLHGG